MALSPEDRAEVRRLARLEADAVFSSGQSIDPNTGRYQVVDHHPNDFGTRRNTAFETLDAMFGGDPFVTEE